MLKSIYYIVILVLAITMSCEKDAENVKLPDFHQKIVIKAFISPSDSISYVGISSNRPVFGELNQNLPLPNVKAWISNGSREIQLDTSRIGFKFFRKDMAIEEGKTYTLRVMADNGLAAEASCTVPLKQNFNLKIDTMSGSKKYADNYIEKINYVKFSFTDFPGEKNYYRATGSFNNIIKNSNGENYKNISLIMFDPNIKTDISKDGTELHFNSTNIYFNNENLLEAHITCFLLSTDKAYYDYHLSLVNYTDSEDPFTEISPVYSNVINGLGIFAAYTRDSVVFRLK